MNALAYATQLLSSLPGLIAAGIEITAFIQDALAKLETFQTEGRDPTAAEWDELNQRIDQLRGQLHAP